MLSLSPSVTKSQSPEKKPGVIIIEGHVQGLANTRILGREGIPIIVVDKDNCIARYSKYCKKYFKCPDYLSEEFIDFLIDLDEAEEFKDWLLLPSNDHAVYNISRNKDKLAKHYRIVSEGFETIEKIYNKRLLISLAWKIGVPTPETVMPETSNPNRVDLRYPLIIRGNNGLSFYRRYRSKAIIIKNRHELSELWEGRLKGIEPNEYFVQEVLPDESKTVSVTVFSEKGEIYTYWMGIKLREHPVRFGTATCCKSGLWEELLEPSRRLMKELNYTGVCEIEYIKDVRDGVYKLIEINARTWLWVGLAERCGVDYPLAIYRYIYENQFPVNNLYQRDLNWINLFTDLFYSLQRVFKGIDKMTNILESYSTFTEACWDGSDPVPFFMYALLVPSFLKKR